MPLDLLLASLHHILIFALFGILAAELVLIVPGFSGQTLSRIGRIDGWYGIFALAIVAAGGVRAVFAAKGWAYYSTNYFFWSKMAVFVLIALLSAWPTVRFIQWRRRLQTVGELPDALAVARVRSVLWAEVALFALLPIFAAAMARGYGQMG